jgi:hypothetical protein
MMVTVVAVNVDVISSVQSTNGTVGFLLLNRWSLVEKGIGVAE